MWHTGTEGFSRDMLLMSEEELERVKALPNNQENAARFIIEQVHAHPGQVTLLCIGALTNIAIALRLDPELPKLIHVCFSILIYLIYVQHVVFMGQGHRMKPEDSEKLEQKWFEIPGTEEPLTSPGKMLAKQSFATKTSVVFHTFLITTFPQTL